jgi:hypothetical protein
VSCKLLQSSNVLLSIRLFLSEKKSVFVQIPCAGVSKFGCPYRDASQGHSIFVLV